MFSRVKAAISQKDIKSRILFTLLILFIFRLGVGITVPGINTSQLVEATSGESSGIFAIMNLLGGGALANYSILGLGVAPYITASIVIQLLAMDVIPYLTDLQKGGEQGKRKLNSITRYLTVVLSFAQAYGITYTFSQGYGVMANPGIGELAYVSLIMTAGTMFLLWLADQISAKGIGNGVSMIIFGGIVAKLPYTFNQVARSFIDLSSDQAAFTGVLKFGVYILVFVLLLVFVIFTQQAERKIPIQYASSTARMGRQMTYLPLKVNVAGVIPVIFASAIMMAPITIASFLPQNDVTAAINKIFNYTQPIGLTIYVILIIAFTYFYAHLQVDAKKLSENLAKSNGYIPGIRPGLETEKYIIRVINRLCFVGSLSLALIAAIPVIIPMVTNVSTSAAHALGGTGLIIVIGVALEFVNRIDSMMAKRTYKGFIQ